MRLPFQLRCPDARNLNLSEQDRQLSWGESLKLGLHLSMCKMCIAFDGQLRATQTAMKAWRSYHEGSNDVTQNKDKP